MESDPSISSRAWERVESVNLNKTLTTAFPAERPHDESVADFKLGIVEN